MSFGQKAFIYDSGKVLINPAVKELQQDQLAQLVSIDGVVSDILQGQLPDGHSVNVAGEVTLWRGDSQADAIFVQWSGSQQVTVQGSVAVVTQGNTRLNVDTGLTTQTDALTNAELRAAPVAVENLAQLVPEQYDDIELGYTGLDLTTVTYRSGGAVVATLTLTYTLGQLTRVVRS